MRPAFRMPPTLAHAGAPMLLVPMLVLMLAPMLVLALATDTPAIARSARPGIFDYYALALSWSPTYCASRDRKRRRREPQCDGPRPYAFVLHGLWPQYERGWPKNCRTARRPWVPRRVIDAMLDIMPSPGLVIHEYKKHGVCTGLGAGPYFALSRKLYAKITIPERFRRLEKPLTLSPREIEAAFLEVNPSLTPEMISVSCNRRKRLRGVRICFTRGGKPRACGPNEAKRKLCRTDRVLLPPMRHSAPQKPRGRQL